MLTELPRAPHFRVDLLKPSRDFQLRSVYRTSSKIGHLRGHLHQRRRVATAGGRGVRRRRALRLLWRLILLRLILLAAPKTAEPPQPPPQRSAQRTAGRGLL